MAPQRRQKDPQQRKTQLLQRLVEELKAEWPEALDQQIRGLGRLYLAHLLGSGGERAEDHEPDSEGSAQRGAARLPRAKGKHRVAAREEKGRREELARRGCVNTRGQGLCSASPAGDIGARGAGRRRRSRSVCALHSTLQTGEDEARCPRSVSLRGSGCDHRF